MSGRPIDPRPAAKPAHARQSYEAPRLGEYGSVAKLTQGTLTTMNDGGGGVKMKCL
jgi:hypothetical protein